MFNFAEDTKDMTAVEILNYYRNRYYAEPQVTERGIVANAINDVLPNMVEVVQCKDCKYWKAHDGMIEANVCYATFDYHGRERITAPTDFCSYGERKEK